jgi:hypothetical protein
MISARQKQPETATREQICAIAMCGHRPVKIGSVNAIVILLEAKVAGQ